MTVLARIDLETDTDAAALDRVHEALAQLWRQARDVSDLDRTMFEIAVLEVAANIVRHSVAATECSLTAQVLVDAVEAVLEDNGGCADVDLATADWPDEMAQSGRGLPMARSAVDHFSYHRVESVNVWRLRRARSR